jgi:hypothetical protein
VIPFDYITEWRAEAAWIDDAQVEQDLVISRALVEIFRHPALADSLALRGGTALSKLQLRPPARYSEDIDLVQTTAQPAGPMMNALRAVLESWLGRPKWKQGEGRITFYFRYTAEGTSPVPMRLKVEANTREHFALYGLRKAPFKVGSRWFEGRVRDPDLRARRVARHQAPRALPAQASAGPVRPRDRSHALAR